MNRAISNRVKESLPLVIARQKDDVRFHGITHHYYFMQFRDLDTGATIASARLTPCQFALGSRTHHAAPNIDLDASILSEINTEFLRLSTVR